MAGRLPNDDLNGRTLGALLHRPIAAMVISIIMVMVGVAAMIQLPSPSFQISCPRKFSAGDLCGGRHLGTIGCDPIEQQMSGVDNMIYIYS